MNLLAQAMFELNNDACRPWNYGTIAWACLLLMKSIDLHVWARGRLGLLQLQADDLRLRPRRLSGAAIGQFRDAD